MSGERAAHDFRSDHLKHKEGAVLVVRKGNRYGAALPGERVLVDEAEVLNSATLSACMLEADYEKHLAKAAEAKTDAPKSKSKVKDMVEAGMAAIEAARQKKMADAAEAAKDAPPQAPIPQPPNQGGKKKKAKPAEE